MRGVAFAGEDVVGESGEVVAVAFFSFEEDGWVLDFGVELEFEISEAVGELRRGIGVAGAGKTGQAE